MSKEYRLPEDAPVVINFSGGRSSGYMLTQILKEYGGTLPDNVHVVFCNTGGEFAETLDFVHEFETRYKDLEIFWLEHEYRRNPPEGELKTISKRVDYESASRNYEPFTSLIVGRTLLPYPTARICTQALKINTTRLYFKRELGIDQYYTVLGIRADESSRFERMTGDGSMRNDNEVARLFPMVYAGVTEQEILRYWKKESEFDLGIEGYMGNCTLCFMKKPREIIRIIQENPGVEDWWLEMENTIVKKRLETGILRKPEMAQFNKRYTIKELVEFAKRQKSLPSVLDMDESAGDCFCSD